MRPTWPDASLDPVRRARVLASTLPGAGVVETVVPVPFERYWGFLSDLEASVPSFDPQVHRLVVDERDGERLSIRAWSGPLRTPARFDVTLTDDGWCLMVQRHRAFLVIMAAVPEGSGTRALHVEAVPRRGIGTLLRPVMQRNVEADVRGIRRQLGAGA